MLPQPGHHDENSSERRDPVPFSEAELEWRFRCRNSLEGAQLSAIKATLFGVLPFCIFAVATCSMGGPNAEDRYVVKRIGFLLGVLLWTIIFGGFYVLLTGLVSGWIAHRFAFETTVPVSRLALALAWVANLSLWGWAVVVVMADS